MVGLKNKIQFDVNLFARKKTTKKLLQLFAVWSHYKLSALV